MHDELWDTESGNRLGDDDTEREALAVVRDALIARARDDASGRVAEGW